MSATPLLETRNLRTYFRLSSGIFARTSGYVRAVDEVNITIEAGEIVSVVGESGCGKSTLGLSLLGLNHPTGGEIKLNGNAMDISRLSSWNSYRREYQIIFQDPQASLNPRHTIYEALAEPFLIHTLATKKNVREMVGAALEAVGISPDLMHRYPHAFSGGQKQRINIARVIGLEPKLIICDEITAALDVSVQAQIVALLLELKKKMNLALLFISHDISLVRAISSRLYVMYLGKIAETGAVPEIFQHPRHPYTRALLDAVPSLHPGKRPSILKGEIPSPANIPQGCSFRTRCVSARERCAKEAPPLVYDEIKMACFFPLGYDGIEEINSIVE